MVHVVWGNNKIGKTPNVSLPPIFSCGENATYCQDFCYAVKFYRMYPEVKRAWDENLREVTEDRDYYFNSIRRYLLRCRPEYFRWHVAEDILDQDYFDRIVKVAYDYDETLYVVFTKRYDLRLEPQGLSNLSVVLSAWPGLELPDSSLPVAFTDHPSEERRHNFIECPENCESCRACWNLAQEGKNVLLHMKRR